MKKLALFLFASSLLFSCSKSNGILTVAQVIPMDSNYSSTLGPLSKINCGNKEYAKEHVFFFSESKVNKVQFFMPELTYFMSKGDILKDSIMANLINLKSLETIQLSGNDVTIDNKTIKTQTCDKPNHLFFEFNSKLYYLEKE